MGLQRSVMVRMVLKNQELEEARELLPIYFQRFISEFVLTLPF